MTLALRTVARSFAALGMLAALLSGPAQAHPHVWVTVETTVVYKDGSITGFQHKWTFDDMYTAMAIQGLDTDGDGVYSREELKELAQVNIDGLSEFGYFTHAKLGKSVIKAKPPIDYYLVHKDGLLSLHFTLPLEQPVMADAEGFNFSVFDESFFIAFDFEKNEPVKLAGAPDGCAADIGIPENELADLQALNQSFGGQLTAGDANQGAGLGYARTVTLGCKKS